MVVTVRLDLDTDGFTYRKWGDVRTQDGMTHYGAGDYLVYKDPDREDAYAVAADKFELMYELT